MFLLAKLSKFGASLCGKNLASTDTTKMSEGIRASIESYYEDQGVIFYVVELTYE
jgi:hypothetical protein